MSHACGSSVQWQAATCCCLVRRGATADSSKCQSKPTPRLLHQPALAGTLAQSIVLSARRAAYRDQQSRDRDGKGSQVMGELFGVVLRMSHQPSIATHSCKCPLTRVVVAAACLLGHHFLLLFPNLLSQPLHCMLFSFSTYHGEEHPENA
jgi:hypothetical protein